MTVAIIAIFAVFLSVVVNAVTLTKFDASQFSDNQATLKYLPSYVSDCGGSFNSNCDGKWWPESRGAYVTIGSGTSIVFTFQGSCAEFYGVKFDYSARGYYTVDGGAKNSFSAVELNKDTPTVGLLFSVSNLDSSLSHTITILFNDEDYHPPESRRWLSLTYINYQASAPSTTTSAASTTTAASPSVKETLGAAESSKVSPVSTSSGGISKGVLAGAIVAALGGVVVLGGVLFWLWLRKSRKAIDRGPERIRTVIIHEPKSTQDNLNGQGNGGHGLDETPPGYTLEPERQL
ncbi:hypothetical protein DL96DRAFT_347204 [Flagelloscypha sp. PMI_526]|nr:hypothetical protein DL96DRAFT_347204 [Flagelloscypha sp. PMI_526]